MLGFYIHEIFVTDMADRLPKLAFFCGPMAYWRSWMHLEHRIHLASRDFKYLEEVERDVIQFECCCGSLSICLLLSPVYVVREKMDVAQQFMISRE